MKRLFIDSSVLFSAAYSSRGHARDLIIMAAREEVILGLTYCPQKRHAKGFLSNRIMK